MDGALIAQYRAMHEEEANGINHFPGRSVLQHAWLINQLIRKHNSVTLLDYGCGLGMQYSKEHVQKWWGIHPTLYDPAVPRYAKRPSGVYDGVICSDVLEHVPRNDVAAVIQDVMKYAVHWAFFSICCRPANRLLPDGTNAHCTILPPDEWRGLLKLYGREGLDVRVEFNP